MGRSFSIFRFPTVDRLLKVCRNEFKDKDEELLRAKADATFRAYYEKYRDRFQTIGWPEEHTLSSAFRTFDDQ